MRITHAILALLSVALAIPAAGCYSDLPSPAYYPNGSDRDWIEHARDVWEAREDLPSVRTESCDDAALHFRVAHVGSDAFEEACSGYCAPGSCPGYRASNVCEWGCAGECYRRMGRKDRWRVAIVHESKDLAKWSRHGIMHMLEDCSGLDPGGDEAHAHQGVWGSGGVWRQLRRDGSGGEP